MTDSPSKKSLSQGTPKPFTSDRKETSPKRNQRIKTHEDLAVFQMAFTASMEIFELTKTFPPEERYSLTDQFRRSSRSVCANLAEAWSKRRYKAAFAAKLNDCEAEARETQVWLRFAVSCKYMDDSKADELYGIYNGILAGLHSMIGNRHLWVIGSDD
jgi:four helix bundle protein